MTRGEARRQRMFARRQQLQLRSAELRNHLAVEAQAFQAPMAMADRVGAGASWLVSHPEWPLGALVLVVIFRPRVLLRWAGRGVWAWQLWRRVRPLSERILRPLDVR